MTGGNTVAGLLKANKMEYKSFLGLSLQYDTFSERACNELWVDRYGKTHTIYSYADDFEKQENKPYSICSFHDRIATGMNTTKDILLKQGWIAVWSCVGSIPAMFDKEPSQSQINTLFIMGLVYDDRRDSFIPNIELVKKYMSLPF